MAKRPVVDQELCTGCGTCAAIADGCFELDESTEKAFVKNDCSSGEADIQEAIDTCPETAISWAE
jgi:ferredoxin